MILCYNNTIWGINFGTAIYSPHQHIIGGQIGMQHIENASPPREARQLLHRNYGEKQGAKKEIRGEFEETYHNLINGHHVIGIYQRYEQFRESHVEDIGTLPEKDV